MKIKKVEIENFVNLEKTLKPIKFSSQLKLLNFIIGENGAGKSSWINVLKEAIGGVRTDAFTFDNFNIEFEHHEPIRLTNIAKIKNFYAEYIEEFYNEGGFGSSVNENSYKTQYMDVNSPSTEYIDIMKKAIINVMQNNYGVTKNIDDMKSLNMKHAVGGASYYSFSNFISGINNLIIKQIPTSEATNQQKTDFATNIYNKLSSKDTDLREGAYGAGFHDIIETYSWLTLDEKKRIIDLIDKWCKHAHEINMYLNTVFFPLKPRFDLLSQIEFIHSERIVADALKREKIDNLNLKNIQSPLYYEYKKNHDDFLIFHNDAKNKLLENLKTEVNDNLYMLSTQEPFKINEKQKEYIEEMLNNSSNIELDFIRKIFSSKKDVSQTIIAWITQNDNLIKTIGRIDKMATEINECIDRINYFLQDTFECKIVLNNNKICVENKIYANSTNVVGPNFKYTSVNDFKFSSGQKSIIYILSNLFLTDKHIYVIDEPELGLSIIWQDKLKKVFTEMIGKKKQLIVITHSDYIYSRKRKDICEIPF